MNISTMRIFTPFTVDDGRCILSSPEAWREPLEWHHEAKYWTHDGETYVPPDINVLVQPDPFANRIIGTADGLSVLRCDVCGKMHPDDDDAAHGSCDCGRFMPRMEWATMADIVRDLFALIDSCPLLTWWLPTRHPERVRDRWPDKTEFVGPKHGFVPHAGRNLAVRENVRLGIPDDILPDLMVLKGVTLHDLCGACFILRDDGEVEVLG